MRLFSAWKRWLVAAFRGVSPDLHELNRAQQLEVLAAYGRYVKEGDFSDRKHNVQSQTVQMAFRAISTTLELDGQRNPLETAQGKYPKKISQLLESYRRTDKAPVPKLAVPVKVVNHLRAKSTIKNDPKTTAVADLCLIAFYYLLRVGEYTYHNPNQNRRTQQFRLCDITLWQNTTKLDPRLPEGILMKRATAATLNISNQKNGVRQQTIHQEAIHNPNCPVRAIIRRVKHITNHTRNPQTMIGTYFTKKGILRHVSGRNINDAIKQSVSELQLDKVGLPPEAVSSHSLRSGGAMAMHLNNVSDNTIKKMGRWTSDTFLMYIHQQISAFSGGLTEKMSTPIDFHNVAHQFEPTKGPILVYA